MPANEQDFIDLVKAGEVNADELQGMFSSDSLSSLVNVSDWGICYSSTTGQLSMYATVESASSSNPITGLGMLAYSGNGSTMYCLQYNNGYSATSIAASIGTALYNTNMGNQALCVIYGWTQNGSFYIPQTLTIGSC